MVEMSTEFRYPRHRGGRLRRFTAAFVALAATAAATATVLVGGTSAPASAAGCRLAHIGDSTTVGMISSIGPEYAKVGWPDAIVSAGGGRAIVRAKPGDITGLQAVQTLRGAGFVGCWVVALGTNDSANAAVQGGSPQDQDARRRDWVETMMAAIGNQPVMWVNVHMESVDTFYTVEASQSWNDVLRFEAKRYPNLYIYDWDSVVVANPSWLGVDKIHYTTTGFQQRAHFIAQAAKFVFGNAAVVTNQPVVSSPIGTLPRTPISTPIATLPGTIISTPIATLPPTTPIPSLPPATTVATVPTTLAGVTTTSVIDRPNHCPPLCRW